MQASDGAEIHYRAWAPKQPTKRAVLLFHRGHEHSGRWRETVDRLALDDAWIFAWDARGHGKSSGARGDAPDMGRLLLDADEFSRHLEREHGVSLEQSVVIAHSVGAVIAAAWVHDFAPPIRGMALVTPAFRVKLYVPFAIPALRVRERLLGPGNVKSYVKSRVLTHDPVERAAYDADSMIFRQISVRVLLDLFDTSTRLLADAGAITTPTMVIGAGSDWVVRVSAQRAFVDKLGSSVKSFEVMPNAYHALFHETCRGDVVSRLRDFVRARFEERVDRSALLEADRRGFTREEFERLSKPGGVMYAPARFFLRTLGRLSHGIDLGWKSGFDSGLSLDHVYENAPSGRTPLGRFIDRQYLNSIGWRGIRVRRMHLESLLSEAIEATRRERRPGHLVDIATGAGRYVLETLRSVRAAEFTALLRDNCRANLDAAKAHAERLGVPGVRFEVGDAFDEASLAALRPAPAIAIVSGLYELFPSNEPVRRSLRGLASALQPGARLIYTNQPWHPQVEFIARVLVNREGEPWVMRRRSQAEMDELVRDAGFEKSTQRIDRWGIFSVCVARRR